MALEGTGQNRSAGVAGRLSPAFSTVTLSGARLDHAGLRTFFAKTHDSRPALEIAIDELETLLRNEDGAVVAYRERQESALGGTTMRRSTAVFTRDESGAVQWLRLHETPCA